MALLGCGDAREPIAHGPERDIAAATRAARRCGIVEIRHDPLSEDVSMFLIGPENTETAVNCTRDWIRAHAPHIALTPERARELGLSNS